MNLLATRFTIVSLCVIVSSAVIASPISNGTSSRLPSIVLSKDLSKINKANWFEDLFFKVRASLDTKLSKLEVADKPKVEKQIELPSVVISDHMVSTSLDANPIVPLTPPNCGCGPTCIAGQLGGQVWEDYNSDGVKQSFENTGVGSISVTAYDCSGTAYGPVTTNACGYYSFANAIPLAKYV